LRKGDRMWRKQQRSAHPSCQSSDWAVQCRDLRRVAIYPHHICIQLISVDDPGQRASGKLNSPGLRTCPG
jgi:hypothetical protein